MFRSIQWRIAIPFILLIVVSMSVLGIYLTSFARNTQLENLRSRLEDEARITAEASLPAFLGQGGDLDTLAKKLGMEIDARVTIIALNGTVLGDSQEDPATMENHATRPEVIDALASGLGESTRYSTTLGEMMMYVAVPITNQSNIVGVARVALPLAAVENSLNQVTLIIILAVVVMAVLAIVAAVLISRATTRPLRRSLKHLKELPQGNWDRKYQYVPEMKQDSLLKLLTRCHRT